MPLVFSPLTEKVLDSPPTRLLPKRAFVMRQLGEPPEIDLAMTAAVTEAFEARGFSCVDADTTTGGKDYLERILGLIRGTAFTVAIFSDETRGTAMANIALELGFAAMCGKPLVVVKSEKAAAPSDLKRTDWIVYDPDKPKAFDRKIKQAIDEIEQFGDYEENLLEVALEAKAPDCGVALERAIKGFLLTADECFIEAAEALVIVLDKVDEDGSISDLERLRTETKTFVRQARKALKAEKKVNKHAAA